MEQIPSSPPLLNTELPTSSSPPMFSSDGPLEDAEAGNYSQKRCKRKYKAPWYDGFGVEATLPVLKRSRFTRNVDSGVWMGSDTSVDGLESVNSSQESLFSRLIKERVSRNENTFSFDGVVTDEKDLHQLDELNKVFREPLDPGESAPGSYYYHPMIPQLYLSLSRNSLKHLSPSIFNLDHLSHLILRDNELQELPPQVCQLKNLLTLDLCNNRLEYLPEEVLSLLPPHGNLDLRLHGNPLLRKFENNLAYLRSPVPSAGNSASSDSYQDIVGSYRESFSQHGQAGAGQSMRVVEIWFLRWLEAVGHSTERSSLVDGLKDSNARFIGHTPPSYYDQVGRLMKQSPRPASQDLSFDVIVRTEAETYDIPEQWYVPSEHEAVPSLVVCCAMTAFKYQPVSKTREMLEEYAKERNEDLAPEIERVFDVAQQNDSQIFSAVRKCSICKNAYVVARAEWVEFWSLKGPEYVPIKRQTCSWSCVPALVARKPQKDVYNKPPFYYEKQK